MGVWEKIKEGAKQEPKLSSSFCEEIQEQYNQTAMEIRESSNKSMKLQLLKHIREVERAAGSLCTKTSRRRVLISIWAKERRQIGG